MLAELGDFRRFANARELMGYLGLTPSEYSSGDQRHRGHITKTGPATPAGSCRGRLALPAPPARISQRTAATSRTCRLRSPRAPGSAQVRLHHRHRSLTAHGKRSTVANVAVARELAGFLWAAMTHQPLRDDQEVAAA